MAPSPVRFELCIPRSQSNTVLGKTEKIPPSICKCFSVAQATRDEIRKEASAGVDQRAWQHAGDALGLVLWVCACKKRKGGAASIRDMSKSESNGAEVGVAISLRRVQFVPFA